MPLSLSRRPRKTGQAELKDGGDSGRLYHIDLKKSDVGRVALLPGDPDRVPDIARHFRKPRPLRSHREYVSWSGYIGSERVVAMSTGIGGPSAAIAVEELARLGVDVMIRIGTCGSIQESVKVGTVVIADAAVRLDGTTDQYVPKGYPAAATPEVTLALRDAAAARKRRAVVGLAASTDSFYVGQGRTGKGGYFPTKSATLMSDLQQARVLCFEMESSTLFTLGRIYGLKTGALFGVVANRVTNDFQPGAGVDAAIEIAVEAVKSFRRRGI
jgi:uridine phosphorylase